MGDRPTATPDPTPGGGRTGAYGLALTGFGAGSRLLGPAREEWPTLELAVVPAVAATDARAPGGEAFVEYTDGGAEITLGPRGCIVVSRSPLRAAFALTHPLDEHELLHPHLGGVAAVAGRWLGRVALHAGTFVVGGGVWGVLGGREAGKSSLLAWLALHDVTIVGDDVLVLADGCALPGPRFVDLRRDTAARLGVGEALGRVGARDRWRMPLASDVRILPLRGWILLGWGDALALDPVVPSRRLLHLARQLTVGAPPPDPASLIELAALPMLELRRPRDWRVLEAAAQLLLDRLDGFAR